MIGIDEIALAGLLHDIGKFAQRADICKLKDIYKPYDYKYTHAAYSAQILHEMVFNLGATLSDDAAMHHNPKNDNQWIIASADRMASGFEREKFVKYNEAYDKEDFRKQRLWYLFDETKKFKIDTLSPNNLKPQEDNAITNEYDKLWTQFLSDIKKIKEHGSSSTDFFTIDYLLKKYTTFIPSSTSFKIGGYDAVKANIPLYEHSKATSIFTAAISKLHKENNLNIVNYYKGEKSDIEQKDLLMICGDFFGIQKFIFDFVEAKYASKILRAKSAYIQLLTKAIAFFIVEELGLSYQSIISTSAGKFEILGINTGKAKEKLKQIQQKLNSFFIENYFGETGVGICSVPCSLADFIIKNRYKSNLRKKIDIEVEKVKFKKFDLLQLEPILKGDTTIKNETLCPLCHKRKKDGEECGICRKFVKIGEMLAKSGYLIFSKKKGQLKLFKDIWISFVEEPKVYEEDDIAIFDIKNDDEFRGYAKWELASYVATKIQKDEIKIKTFEELAQSSVKAGLKDGKRDRGVEALMALKGDVDSMGKYIKNSDTTNSFARFNFFSRMVDYFFSVKASQMMKGRDLYTVFAGGDDIFVLGAWDEVIDFAKELRQEFKVFSEGSPLSLSVGMIMTKSNKPINFVAHIAEEALEKAKDIDDEKDAITLFRETVKWNNYLDENNAVYLQEELVRFDNETYSLHTAFLYRLLELVEMSKKSKSDPIQTMWKSKLAYSFSRNILEKIVKDKEKTKDANGFLSLLNDILEDKPKSAKMVLSEYIYKRRD